MENPSLASHLTQRKHQCSCYDIVIWTFSLNTLPATLTPTHSASATLASLLSFEHTRKSPSSSALSPLPGMLFSVYLCVLLSLCITSSFPTVFYSKVILECSFLTFLSKLNVPRLTFLLHISCFYFFLLSTFYCLVYFILTCFYLLFLSPLEYNFHRSRIFVCFVRCCIKSLSKNLLYEWYIDMLGTVDTGNGGPRGGSSLEEQSGSRLAPPWAGGVDVKYSQVWYCGWHHILFLLLSLFVDGVNYLWRGLRPGEPYPSEFLSLPCGVTHSGHSTCLFLSIADPRQPGLG